MKALAMAAAALAVTALTPAARALTPEQVSAGFVEAVGLCLQAAQAGGPIAALPDSARMGIDTAPDMARQILGAAPAAPVYDVLSAEGTVLVEQPEPTTCRVVAYGPSVEATFVAVSAQLRGAGLVQTVSEDLSDVYIREYRRTRPEGGELVIRLDGTEPNMGNNRLSYPLLIAVMRWPAQRP